MGNLIFLNAFPFKQKVGNQSRTLLIVIISFIRITKYTQCNQKRKIKKLEKILSIHVYMYKMEKYNIVTYNYRYIRKYECNILEDILKLFT